MTLAMPQPAEGRFDTLLAEYIVLVRGSGYLAGKAGPTAGLVRRRAGDAEAGWHRDHLRRCGAGVVPALVASMRGIRSHR